MNLSLRAALMAVIALGVGACAGPRPVVAPPPDLEAPTETGESSEPEASGGPMVSGYHVYWSNDAWVDYPFDVLDTVFFFDLEVGEDGRIVRQHGWPDRWLEMQRHAAEQDVDVVPVVSLMDATAFRKLFESDSARTVLRDEILALFEDFPETAGVQLDFEVFVPMPPGIRDHVTGFVRDLDAAMAAAVPGRSLSMFLLAYDEADVFDETALAAILDYVVVQGYDLHARGDEQAGPVAATQGWGRRNWSFILEHYRDLGVPAGRIVMAVPYFGYEWPTVSEDLRSRTRGPGVSMTLAPVDSAHGGSGRITARTRATMHGQERDPESGIPYYGYADSTGAFQGWFEDEESLDAKYRFVRENGLRGVAIFPLAYGDEQTHASLRRAFGMP